MTKEIWKDVKGYEGAYQVSSLGRVKSLERLVKARGGSNRLVEERILKRTPDGNGYLFVGLHSDGSSKTQTVHKLVAIAFKNHKPNGHKIVVDHIDNNKKNNRASNLQLISNRQNTSKDKTGCASKYTGVYWSKIAKKWQSSIYINGKRKYLGLFIEELDAHNAYQTALTNHLKENNGKN